MRYASVELIGERREARKVDLCLYYFKDFTTNKKKIVRYKRKSPPRRLPNKKIVWDPSAPMFTQWRTQQRREEKALEKAFERKVAHVIAKVAHNEIQHDLFAADGIAPPKPVEEPVAETPADTPTPETRTVKKLVPLAAHLGVVKYGKKFPPGTNDLTIELYAFRNQLTEEQGGLGAYQHFKNIVDLLWNRKGSSRKFIWSPWADEMIQQACTNKYLAVAGCASSGKCWKIGTRMLRASGECVNVEDIRVGDLLLGDDSQPRTVLSLHRGRAPMYKIRLHTGDEFVCNGAHELVVKRTDAGPKAKHRIGEIEVISVDDWLSKTDRFRDCRRMFAAPAEFPPVAPPSIDPRIYGLWLGDGHTHSPRISVGRDDPATLQYIKDWGVRDGWRITEYPEVRNCTPLAIRQDDGNEKGSNKFMEFVSASMSADRIKYIRPEYLRGSSATRMELLAGIIDADGHASACKGVPTYFEIAVKHDRLKDDIVFLARSLGFTVSAKLRTTKCQTGEFASWRINISGDTHTIPTLRKKCAPPRRKSEGLRFSVEAVGEDDFYGFTLDGNKQHLLWNFTVAHNSDSYALWAIVSYLAAPTETLVLLTSTTLREARRRVWKSIEEFWMACPGLPGKLVSSLGQIKGMSKDGGFWEGTGLVLVPSEKKSEREAVGKLVGIKQKRVILVADELPELPESIVHAAYSNLSANPYFQMIGLGNPASHFDAFGVFSQPDAGWGSINETDYEWKTARGKCIRFDAELCPNVVEDRIIYPWMPTREKINQIKSDYGAKSLAYYRMVKGFWAPDGISSGIYSEADLVRGLASKRAVWKGTPTPVAGLDPSFTAGGDRTIAYFGFVGQDDDGLPLIEFSEFVSLQEDVSDKRTPRTFQIAQQFIQHCQRRGILPRNAGVDATGGGGPFCDALATLWGTDAFVRVHFGGAPSTRPVSATDKTPANERYANRMSEIWYIGQELLRSGQIRNVTPDLAREMVSRLYETRKGGTMKIKVESKTDYKARTGKSPDIADAAFILLDVCRSRFGLVGNERFEVNKDRQGVWNKKMRALDAVFSTGSINLS